MSLYVYFLTNFRGAGGGYCNKSHPMIAVNTNTFHVMKHMHNETRGGRRCLWHNHSNELGHLLHIERMT